MHTVYYIWNLGPELKYIDQTHDCPGADFNNNICFARY